MERSCFRKTVDSCVNDGVDRLFTEKKFLDRYSLHVCRVLSNLNTLGSVKDAYLINQLMSGKINPVDVADLTSWQLCPNASSEERREIETRKKIKFEYKVSRAYKCKKCGGDKTIPIEFQSRCADECSSLSVKCVNCEYTWRK
jgi:DNA-directed RNA polymerase subunit M/transcription elongation factor TFIIS